MKVTGIYKAGIADVYNMEVEGTHDFAINNGIIAHNCYDELRYVCMANPISPRPRIVNPAPVYDPLDRNVEPANYDRYAFYRRY